MRKISLIVAGLILLGFVAGINSVRAADAAASPLDAAAYGQRGVADIKAKDYAKAVVDFTEAIKLNDQVGNFFGGRGDGYRMTGQNELAVADYTMAIKLAGKSPHYFGMRGNCYQALKKYDEAIADMQQALDLGHTSVDYFKKQIGIMQAALKAQGAAGEVKPAATPEPVVVEKSAPAVAANPAEAAVYGQRAMAALKNKDYETASADFTEAIKLNDQNGNFFGGRGDCYRVLGKNELAIPDYTEALRLAGKSPHYFGMRGNCYQALGKFAEAIADMQQALELGHPSVDYFKKQIEIMQAKLKAGAGNGVPVGADNTGFRLAAIFSDHMVLQRDKPVPVWGWADAGEKVTVEFAGQKKTAVADATGKWLVKLDPMPASAEPRTLVVTGRQVIVRGDVLVGDVWLASGQSNMEFILISANNSDQEIARSSNPLLRHFLVKKNAASEPVADTEGQWVAAAPETSGGFTAVGYFFAKKLQQELKIPVGLVHSSWGGTHSEAWTSGEAIATVPDLKAARERLWASIKDNQSKRKEFVDGMNSWLKENGREDKPVADAAAYAGMDVAPDGWIPVKVPGAVRAQGLPDAGAVWLRKEINLTKIGATFSLALPIDGYESVYWNGQLLKQMTYQEFPGTGYVRRHGVYSIQPGLLRAGKNVIAIRFYEPVEPAKFTAMPQPGGFLGGNWLARAEYEFPAVDAAKLAATPRPPGIATDAQHVPGALYNGMIEPVRPYAIKGAIWYQGESNAGRSTRYRTDFPLLINSWRKQWNQGDFPFYFCQLANYMGKKNVPGESGWAELREAQSMTLKLPHTGQAVLIDIGESEDIHPRNKQDVGERLAFIALAQDYGKSIPFSGPVYDSMKVENGKIVLTFQHMDGGLAARPLPETFIVKSQSHETAPLVSNRPNSELKGFAICGADKQWVWADAKIAGNNVLVWSDQVAAPVAVRYAWADNPTCNLYNGAGLPASPFRTDDFTPVTVNGKF